MISELENRARLFSIAAHSAVGQKRKYTGEPYWVHPEEVANIIRSLPAFTDEMLAAAWLHDVLEDTEVTPEVLNEEFGEKVTNLVLWVTDVSTSLDGNRETRKAIDRLHLANAPAEAQTIKLADLISNTRSIREHDPSFAKIYIEEKILLLGVLTKGDPILQINAMASVRGDLLYDLTKPNPL